MSTVPCWVGAAVKLPLAALTSVVGLLCSGCRRRPAYWFAVSAASLDAYVPVECRLCYCKSCRAANLLMWSYRTRCSGTQHDSKCKLHNQKQWDWLGCGMHCVGLCWKGLHQYYDHGVPHSRLGWWVLHSAQHCMSCVRRGLRCHCSGYGCCQFRC